MIIDKKKCRKKNSSKLLIYLVKKFATAAAAVDFCIVVANFKEGHNFAFAFFREEMKTSKFPSMLEKN